MEKRELRSYATIYNKFKVERDARRRKHFQASTILYIYHERTFLGVVDSPYIPLMALTFVSPQHELALPQEKQVCSTVPVITLKDLYRS